MSSSTPAEDVRSWGRPFPGVTEVLHASFFDHAYPMHAHDTWTLLMVDRGRVTYELGRHHRSAAPGAVTILPPFVPHDGRAAHPEAGFRKRVIYIEASLIGENLVGPAVDRPVLVDAKLGRSLGVLHGLVERPPDDLEAQTLVAVAVERVGTHLSGRSFPSSRFETSDAAEAFKAYLDAEPLSRRSLDAASNALGWSVGHLVRSFSDTYGVSPHRYLIGRRVDAARHRLLDGVAAAEVAVEVGFCDQAHLTRHFKRILATTPARYQQSARLNR